MAFFYTYGYLVDTHIIHIHNLKTEVVPVRHISGMRHSTQKRHHQAPKRAVRLRTVKLLPLESCKEIIYRELAIGKLLVFAGPLRNHRFVHDIGAVAHKPVENIAQGHYATEVTIFIAYEG